MCHFAQELVAVGRFFVSLKMSGKRKHVSVSLDVKLETLKRLDAGESIKKLASELGVGEVTVGDWRRKRQKIEKFSVGNFKRDDCFKERKTMRQSDYEKTSEALFMWFSQQRIKGSPLSGPMLQEKAKFFCKELKEAEDFSASNGWLNRWKKRYGVRQVTVCGEKLSADFEAANSFRNDLNDLIKSENLTNEQLYNCDETGLNFKRLPSKSLVSRNEKSAPGLKQSKERITVMCCSNASGTHKVRLLVIGKSKKPRAFKNVSIQTLPVSYTNQKKAWMVRDAFKRWFFDEFVPKVEQHLEKKKLPRKALLLIDNAPSHPDVEEICSGDIKALFLPPNVTSLIQPMDQGVINDLKLKYRKKMLTHVLDDESSESLAERIKKINIKDVIYWLAQSWENVKPETIKNSWNNILTDKDLVQNKKEETAENAELRNEVLKLPGCENANDSFNFDEWVYGDEEEEITDDEIMRLVTEEEVEEVEDIAPETVNKISHSDGTSALDIALRYIEQQSDASSTDVLFLRGLRDNAARKRINSQKQSTIDSFFRH